MTNNRRRPHCMIPPHMLEKLLESSDADVRRVALATLRDTTRLRGERTVRASFAGAAVPANGRRTIFDCHHRTVTDLADVRRSEDGAPSGDPSVDQAFDGFEKTRRFYSEVLQRNSIDDRGMRLDGYVHYGNRFNNAFWDGRKMVFGDGDGRMFTDFTSSLDVIAHELTHGVTEHTAALEYRSQSGALNESISDVFGSLVKQWSLGQAADKADWLIGSEVFTPGIGADALRSMKAPGTAYDSPVFGKDPQPDHMSKYVRLPETEDDDNGGVHINSGIPNRAFYLTAVGIGGSAWEAPGEIWYEALKASTTTTQFQDFADTTYAKAGELYGAGGTEQAAVSAAWREVGIRISGARLATAGSSRVDRAGDTTGIGLAAQLDDLSMQVKELSKEVSGLKKGKA